MHPLRLQYPRTNTLCLEEVLAQRDAPSKPRFEPQQRPERKKERFGLVITKPLHAGQYSQSTHGLAPEWLMASQVAKDESLENALAKSHSSLNRWDDNDDCAGKAGDFVYEGCGLPQYTQSFQQNIKSSEDLLALNPRKLCKMGIRSHVHQRQILAHIQDLSRQGSYPRRSNHMSFRQHLSAGMHQHKTKVALKRAQVRAPSAPSNPTPEPQRQPVGSIQRAGGIVDVIKCGSNVLTNMESEKIPYRQLSPGQLSQVRSRLHLKVPSTREQITKRRTLAGRVEEEAWTISNALAQHRLIHQNAAKGTANVLKERENDYTIMMKRPQSFAVAQAQNLVIQQGGFDVGAVDPPDDCLGAELEAQLAELTNAQRAWA
jgi:hypothetical protein